MVVRRKMRDHIEKPEDKEWLKWYNNLSKADHKQYLAKLGLDNEDEEELKEVKKELKKAKETKLDDDGEDE